ncbi:hypothetical protein DNTS_004564 [Danionella cerebrum]|uniref:Myb-like domain-containing protein n=1 Tax=Danionella cerebrum TaxID=2873325 RepID=A0A553QGM8_9TELE|nr:hypothetical protein DNTS_004564 [Danionella translucida]
MRRARISIKPNVRPGGRSLAPAAVEKSSQESTAVDDSQQDASSLAQTHPGVELSAVALKNENVPKEPANKAPSSASTPATAAPQRRSRLTSTPNLVKPKVRPAPALPPPTGKTESSKPSSSLQGAKCPLQPPVAVDASQSTTLLNDPTACSYPPPSPGSTSKLGHPQTSTSTPSPHELCKSPRPDGKGLQEITPAGSHSPYLKLSRVDGPDSPLRDKLCSDKQRVLRALKFKELMKLEKIKVEGKKKRSSGRYECEQWDGLDREKMTLADFIHYLPDTNPMKSHHTMEETPIQTITAPQTPKVQKSFAEIEEEEEDDADNLLVPKVRVAEDGSLILDEESLNVRVQRKSDTVVEDAVPQFERGCTTTYISFRPFVSRKMWSVRETDMFYLAISMVGTDFSLMAKLLTHRTRLEIKRKFVREEKANAWRVEKAFRDKRPYDAEFFSFILKRVLEKDKQKGNRIKLLLKPDKAKKPRVPRGKKSKMLGLEDSIANEDCDELRRSESVCFDFEKENEGSNNMKKAGLSSSMKRRRKNDAELTEKETKSRKTPRKGKSSIDGEDLEVQSVEETNEELNKKCRQSRKSDAKETQKMKKKTSKGKETHPVCLDNDLEEAKSVETDNEDQTCLPVSKHKPKRSKKSDQMALERKPGAKEKRKKRKEKTSEVPDEEPADGEVNMEVPTVPTKKRKHSKKVDQQDDGDSARAKKGKFFLEGATDVCSVAPSAEKEEGEKHSQENAAQKNVSQSSSKRSKKPLPNLVRRTEPKAAVEMEDSSEETQDKGCRDAENQLLEVFAKDPDEKGLLGSGGDPSLTEEQLQKKPVVVLERTPPRLKDDLSSFEGQEHPQTSEEPSPARWMRAEKVKRNLISSVENNEGTKAEDVQKVEKRNLESGAQEEISRSCSKLSTKPMPNLANIKARNTTEPKEAAVEMEDKCREPQEEVCRDSWKQYIAPLHAEEELQKPPELVLEKAPQRCKDSLSPPKDQMSPPSSKSPQGSPGRQLRADKLKCSLTVSVENNDCSKPSLTREDEKLKKLTPESIAQERDPGTTQDQKTLKRAVVVVSREEVEPHLRVQEESTTTGTQQDTSTMEGPRDTGVKQVSSVMVSQDEVKEPDNGSSCAQPRISGKISTHQSDTLAEETRTESSQDEPLLSSVSLKGTVDGVYSEHQDQNASQLFQAEGTQQEPVKYELQPPQVQTSSSSPSMPLAAEQPEREGVLCKSDSHKEQDPVPHSMEGADTKDAKTQLVTSVVPVSNICMSADEPKVNKISIKAPAKRRCKMNIKPKIKQSEKAGSSRSYQLVSTQDLPSTPSISQSETESKQKTSEALKTLSQGHESGVLSAIESVKPTEGQVCSSLTSLGTPQQSFDHQTEEWSLKSSMMPKDSMEMENWCEGVSHILLSDALVPISEEADGSREISTVLVSSSPQKNVKCDKKITSQISYGAHQLDTSLESTPERIKSQERGVFQMSLRSPRRSFTNILKSPQATEKTHLQAQVSILNESIRSPKQLSENISRDCLVQLEKISLEEIGAAQPKHQSTPVTVKTTFKGIGMHQSPLPFCGGRNPRLEVETGEVPDVSPGHSPKVVLHRMPLSTSGAKTSPSAGVSRSQTDYLSPCKSPGVDPEQVSQFYLDNIFTEVVETD